MPTIIVILARNASGIIMNIFLRARISLFFALSLFQAHAGDYQIFKEEGKVGLKDNLGNILIPASYDGLGWSSGPKEPVSGVIGYRVNDVWGLISVENKEVTSASYSKLYPANTVLFVAAKQGKFSGYNFLGAISRDGKIVLPFKYASIDIAGSRAIVSHKSGAVLQYGLLDMGGKELIPVRHKEIKKISHWYAVREQSDRFSMFNASGARLTADEFDSVGAVTPGYVLLKKDNAYGVFGKQGRLVLPITYQKIRVSNGEIELLPFNEWEEIGATDHTVTKKHHYENMIPLAQQYKVISNGNEWLIDQEGQALTPKRYQHLVMASNGFVLFKDKNKWGLLDRAFTMVIPPKFEDIKLNEGLVFAQDSYQQWLIFDTLGVKKSSRPYQQIGKKTGYLWPVMRNGYWGFIERSGEEAIRCVYDKVGAFVEDKVVVGFHGENGIINKQGEWIIYPGDQALQLLTDDLYLSMSGSLTTLKSVENGTIYFTENEIEIKERYLLERLGAGRLWKIDFNGRIENNDPHNERFEEIREPSEGLYAVKIDGMYGFIDDRNRLRISNRYEDVGPFREGVAAVKLRGKWGFIDKYERIKVQPLYQQVGVFQEGLAVVKTSRGYSVINKDGKQLCPPDNDRLTLLESGNWLMEREGRFGIMDRHGRTLINVKYEHLQELGNGFAIIKKFGKFGLVTHEGVDTLPARYDKLVYDARKNVYLGMKKSTWVKATL